VSATPAEPPPIKGEMLLRTMQDVDVTVGVIFDQARSRRRNKKLIGRCHADGRFEVTEAAPDAMGR
jgi:hypothetical protein